MGPVTLPFLFPLSFAPINICFIYLIIKKKKFFQLVGKNSLTLPSALPIPLLTNLLFLLASVRSKGKAETADSIRLPKLIFIYISLYPLFKLCLSLAVMMRALIIFQFRSFFNSEVSLSGH